MVGAEEDMLIDIALHLTAGREPVTQQRTPRNVATAATSRAIINKVERPTIWGRSVHQSVTSSRMNSSSRPPAPPAPPPKA